MEKTKTDLMNSFRMSEEENRARKEMGEEDNRPLKEKLKEVAREVGEFSLLAGMSNIVRGELSVKVVWIFFQMGLLGVFIYLVANNVKNFIKHDVVTKVRETNEFPTYFPAITICNLIYFQTEYSKDYLSEIAKAFGFPDIFNPNLLNDTNNYGFIQTAAFLGMINVVQQNFNQTEIQKLGYTIDDMLLSCTFSQFGCNYTDFAWFFHPNYGNCYQFNVGKDSLGNVIQPKSVLRPGSAGGLSMEVFVGVTKDLEIVSTNYGLAIFVHSNTTSPLSVQPITVYPNAETNVVISKVITAKQPKPYSDCEELDPVKSDIMKSIIKKGIDYYQQDCIIQCYQQMMIENCSCYDIRFVNYLEWKIACSVTNSTQMDCYDAVYNEFLSAQFIEAECMPKCPLECKQTDYTTSISMNGYPTIPYENTLALFSNLYNASTFSQSLRYNVLKVNIYYDSLSYTKINEEPAIDTTTLVSNIGGSMGLMLGVSFATMVELFELSLKFFLVFIRHRKRIQRVRSARIESVSRINSRVDTIDNRITDVVD